MFSSKNGLKLIVLYIKLNEMKNVFYYRDKIRIL